MFFLIPFLAIRIFQAFYSRKWGNAAIDLCEDVSIASQAMLVCFFLPIGIYLCPFLVLYQLIGWYCAFKWQTPVRLEHLRYVLSLSSFVDSIRALKLLPVGAAFLGLTFLSCIGRPMEGWVSLFFCVVSTAGAIGGRWVVEGKRVENPIFQAEWGWLLARKRAESSHVWHFPTENCRFLSPEYPLLRKTISYTGEKLFGPPLEKKPHIIFLFLESFRAKNVGCLGAEMGASPCFDRLAEKGVLFPHFSSLGPRTSRTLLASLTGIATHLDPIQLHSYSRTPLIGLPQLLKEQNYQSALIQGGSTLLDDTCGFAKNLNIETVLGKEDIPAAADQMTSWGIHDLPLLNFAADWLAGQSAPTFVSLFTISNHHPWKVPADWESRFSEPFLQTFSYSDHALGKFVEKLERSGLMERTLLFIAGDHGQELGERGPHIALHNSLYQENLHVPLMILGRGLKPCRINTQASHADLMPTVLDLLGLEAIHHGLGKSLVREEESPLYFSLPGDPKRIGCLKGSLKWIAPDELYDLGKDPAEKKNLAPSSSAEALARETRSYFAALGEIYSGKRWASASLGDAVLDFSHSYQLTDRAIEAMGEKGAALIELNLSNCPALTDRALEWVASHCPHLTHLNASHCPLLTDAGVSQILQKCKELSYLSLEGIDDLSDLPESASALKGLFLKESRGVKGATLQRLSSHLTFLSASLENGRLEGVGNKLLYIWLTDGKEIDGDAMEAFCDRNPLLEYLILERFPLLETLPRVAQLKWLKLEDCPLLNDSALKILSTLPLMELTLIRCPKLTGSGLSHLLANRECKITLSECPGIDAKSIRDLCTQGLQIV